ncbi:MAG: DNA polymerase II [Pseudomonadales bacterium]|nr:DNA polymerase II [Pseudomonadales bacterium]
MPTTSTTATTTTTTTTTVTKGFLLTRQWIDRPALTLHYWLTTDEGPLLLDIANQDSVFFVCSTNIEKTRHVLNSCVGKALNSQNPSGLWYDKTVALKNFNHQPMHAVYFKKQTLLYRARRELRTIGLAPLEADINPTDRFLMERFVTGAMQVQGKLVQEQGYRRIQNPKIQRAEYVPSYTVVSLDIETSMIGEQLYSIAVLAKQTKNAAYCERYVFMIGSSDDNQVTNNQSKTHHPSYLFYFNDELSLMTAFLQRFSQIDPDIIIGWAVINFDLRFLQRKAEHLRLRLSLGRANTECDWRQSRDNKEHYTLTLPGRLVLDGIDTLKSATYNFESFSLQHVSGELLNRGKLIHNVDARGEEITTLFTQDKISLAAYNLEDCQLVWDIFEKTRLNDFAIERAQLTGLAMDRFGGSVASFDNRYLPRLHRAGFVAPNLPENPMGIGSPGGYVMNSEPGMYDHVLVLDFKSLYPSIIRTFKIDPLGLCLGLLASPRDDVRDQQESTVSDLENLVPGYNGAVFDKQHHILPDVIDELWAARDNAKQQKNPAVSQAIKILMNSFYGVLGTPGCRFFDSRLPSSITLRGHDILTRSKDFIEDRGYRVIYGDTDSVFVWLEGQPKDTATKAIQEQGKTLASALNTWWSDQLKTKYQLESHLEIEFETHFKRFIMPTIRGSDRGSKKRYAGLVETLTDTGSELDLVFKGLETVRTDWTLVAREFQRELYRRIFYEEPWKDYVTQITNEIRSGKRDEQLVYRKRLRRRLEEYQRNVPPHVRAARIADEQNALKGLPLKYQRGGWVQYVMTLNGPEPIEYIRNPLDYELYIERQIEPIADGILQFLGTSFNALFDRQLGMFE